MKKIVLFCLVALIAVVGLACSYDSPYPDDMWTQNIYPGVTNTYDIGSPSHSYADGYFTNLFIAGLPVGDNVTGVGTVGRLAQWSGTSTITNATNTDAQVSSAVTDSHLQNTDTILTTNGTVALIDAGVLVYDLKTDRWLHDDRNTFLGVGVAGAGNLSHTALSEGYQNTAIGCDAASSITTGYDNTVVGNNAAESMTTGYYNTIIGSTAGQFYTTAKFNTALGYQALMNSTGGYNTAVGSGALGISGAGTYNTAIGLQAMNQGTGNRNTALGRWAGELNTGDDNVFLGNEAGQNSGAVSDKLYIDNTDTATPLIYGDFSTNDVTINDDLNVVGELTLNGELIEPPAYGELYITTPIVTEMTTAGLYYKILGNTTSEELLHFTSDGLGKLTYTGTEDGRVFQVTASLSSWLPGEDTPAIIGYRIYINGVGDIASTVADVISAGDSLDAMQMTSLITLDHNDYLEIYVVSNVANCSLNVITMSLVISNVD